MNILDKLHQIIDADVAKLFSAAKKASVLATNDVQKAKDALLAAQQRALAASEEARQHAESAAAAAQKAAAELLVEAKAAAERVEMHRSEMPNSPDIN